MDMTFDTFRAQALARGFDEVLERRWAPHTVLERLAAAHRLAVQALWEAPIRQDQGRPLMGWYVILQREA